MKKIGILTFHRAYNYGAVLQAYAMKRIFSAYGDAELIDYWPSGHSQNYKLLDFRFLHKGYRLRERASHLRTFLGKLKTYRVRKHRGAKFENFITRHICEDRTRIFFSAEKIPQHYDAYVYGSDQIWRAFGWDAQNYPNPDLAYFGKGLPENSFRISYAASSGSLDKSVFSNTEVRKLLEKFAYISVREDYLADFLGAHLSRDVPQVLDPTFLVSKEEWTRLAESTPSKKTTRYIVSYNLLRSPEANALAQKASNALGIPSFEIAGGPFGPIDFLQKIHRADMVICTSFHAVVFSILFNKDFYVVGMGKQVGRVLSLLGKLGLQDRILENVDSAVFENRIDYSNVTEKLDFLIKESRAFVDRAMADSAA